MNNFTFNLRTVVHSGASSVEAIPTLFKAKGAQRVLLVSDKGLESLGFVERLASLFFDGREREACGYLHRY